MKGGLKILAMIVGLLMVFVGAAAFAVFKINNPDLTDTRILISYSSVWLKSAVLMIAGLAIASWGVKE